MKRLSAILSLLMLVGTLTACTISKADPPIYTARPTTPPTETQSTPASTPSTDESESTFTTTSVQASPVTATTVPGTSPTPVTTTEAPITTPKPITTTQIPPVTTPKPITTTSIPPVTTPKPITTTQAPPTTTPKPITTVQTPITVTAEPNVIKEGETFTGRAPLPTITMTVNDPDNSAGLSEERIDYSYGIAKDSKPHSLSVGHQQYFDAHNRNALTLDTISEEKVLYLTFDNGYEYEGLTGDILDILNAKNVPATFFCTLSYLEDNPDFVVRMINEGHIVGNHSTTHPVMSDLNKTEMAAELLGVENYLRANFGYSSPYFRFPSGAYTDEALELVDSVGFRSIFWSSAHRDWLTDAQPSAEETFDTITSRLHPGSVILLHAVSQSNTDALADIIDYARAEGYVFRSLDQYPGW